MIVYALRHGELSILYPLIALGYVWVALLSVFVFHETMNPLKVAGIAIIVRASRTLGRGGANDNSGFLDGVGAGRVRDRVGGRGISQVRRAWQ